ncbi:aldo/keto reductase [Paenibacillus sp. FSL R7-0312]|uniref:aldo/keto reductase n=1 Tax=Paenibacillus sp. FSL R7-0312 TaxID=2921682 RepID=UPI0030F66D40
MIHDDQRKEYIATIHEALDSGVHHLNTGDFYGSGKNEMIIGEALKGQKRESTFISVKFGILAAPNGSMYGLDVRSATIKNYITYPLSNP